MSKVKITLVKSKIGQTKHQKLVLEALGLSKIGSNTEKNLTPQISGMVEKVKHLVQIEEIK
ncbi:MAG TPA: 50S ribosomal protein L30 [Bacteroidales bacterium]|jgi:large subunit ribosomal protein L30|nr:50S ribosomal protein L30 [Bacteroidales bacterium]